MATSLPAATPNARIIVVEDEGLIARDIRLSLEDLGYTVAGVASNASEALSLFETTAFDLILMDVKLRGSVDGTHLAEQVRAQMGLPVVYLTAHTDSHTLDRVKASQPYGYVVKPFTTSDLKVSVEIALQRHKLQRQLEEREAWLTAVLRSIGDAVVVTDSSGSVNFMNAAAEELFGVSSSQAVSRLLSDLVTFQAEEQELDDDPVGREGAKDVRLSTGILVRPDGLERVVISSSSPIYRAKEVSSCGSVISFRDISGLKKAELALRQTNEFLYRSNDRLNQLARSLSHDLQEPLRNIRTASELLSRQHDGALNEDALESLGFIKDGCSRMGGLLTSLLDYYRAGSLDHIAATLVDADAPLREALGNLKSSIAESGARIELTPLPAVHSHPVALVQIFQNLIGNALKYRSEKAPVIRISATRDSFFCTFEISDNGMGFDASQKERIFELFTRAHDRNKSGSGIGLATCRKLVEQYGGAIWAESRVGEGATFRFSARAEQAVAAA